MDITVKCFAGLLCFLRFNLKPHHMLSVTAEQQNFTLVEFGHLRVQSCGFMQRSAKPEAKLPVCEINDTARCNLLMQALMTCSAGRLCN